MQKPTEQHPNLPPNQNPQIQTHYHNWNHQNQPLHPKQNQPITKKKKKKKKKKTHTHTHTNKPELKPTKISHNNNPELKPITR